MSGVTLRGEQLVWCFPFQDFPKSQVQACSRHAPEPFRNGPDLGTIDMAFSCWDKTGARTSAQSTFWRIGDLPHFAHPMGPVAFVAAFDSPWTELLPFVWET